MPKITPEEARAMMVQNIDDLMEQAYTIIRNTAATGVGSHTVYNGNLVTATRARKAAVMERLRAEGFTVSYRVATDQRDSDSMTISWG